MPINKKELLKRLDRYLRVKEELNQDAEDLMKILAELSGNANYIRINDRVFTSIMFGEIEEIKIIDL